MGLLGFRVWGMANKESGGLLATSEVCVIPQTVLFTTEPLSSNFI